MSPTVRFIISIPLFYFIARGHNWAIVAMFVLNMIAVESMAYISMRLIKRCNELSKLIKEIDHRTEKAHRVNNVLEDVFDNNR